MMLISSSSSNISTQINKELFESTYIIIVLFCGYCCLLCIIIIHINGECDEDEGVTSCWNRIRFIVIEFIVIFSPGFVIFIVIFIQNV